MLRSFCFRSLSKGHSAPRVKFKEKLPPFQPEQSSEQGVSGFYYKVCQRVVWWWWWCGGEPGRKSGDLEHTRIADGKRKATWELAPGISVSVLRVSGLRPRWSLLFREGPRRQGDAGLELGHVSPPKSMLNCIG